MLFPAAAALVTTSFLLVVSDTVPKLDVNPSCRAAVEANLDRMKGCLADEDSARDVLVKTWSQFTAVERQRCTAETRQGNLASYVELLTCLQLDKDNIKPTTPKK